MMYVTPAIIEQRKALILRILRSDERDARGEAIAAELCERIGGIRPYDLVEEGYDYATIWADSLDDAVEVAAGNVDPSNYEVEDTMWIRAGARGLLERAYDTTRVQLDPEEPECEPGHSHEWESPLSVVGGCRENPGVWGNGGGVIIKSVCRHCGKYRIHDTWAQDPDTGEQGLESVEYRDADEASMEWLESLATE